MAMPPAPAPSAPSAGQGTLQPCPAWDVVLSLFATQTAYSVRQTPEFQLDVVSTASSTCTFNVGAGHVVLRIAAGSQLVWTSAHCAEGQASQQIPLYRGVPAVVPIAWDELHPPAGCPVPGAAVSRGRYTATASDASLTSNTLAFRIT